MTVEEEPIGRLGEHARIPARFEVRSRVDIDALRSAAAAGHVPLPLPVLPVDPPWVKDYDTLEAPASWPERWNVSRWGLLAAYVHGRRAGGCVLAWDTEGVDMLEGRRDLAVLWDLRVAPGHRRTGVGRALVEAAVEWARRRGCTELRIETQDVNVPACQVYARAGCRLSAVDPNAYPELPDETQLVWSYRIC